MRLQIDSTENDVAFIDIVNPPEELPVKLTIKGPKATTVSVDAAMSVARNWAITYYNLKAVENSVNANFDKGVVTISMN